MNRKYLINHSWILLILVIQYSVGEHGPSDKNDTSGIDFETLSIFGVNPTLAVELRDNFLKAVHALEGNTSVASGESRQGENGGVSGGYFQQGGGGNGGGGGGFGPGGGQEDEDDDDSNMAVTPGAGLFGWLSGLFGVASGLGMLNPTRVIQSAVNFFPPNRRVEIQMIVDSLTGFVPQENRTSRPRPRTPPTRPTQLYSNMNGTGPSAPLNSSVRPYGPRPGVGKLPPYSIMKLPMNSTSGMNLSLSVNATTTLPTTTTVEDDDYDESVDLYGNFKPDMKSNSSTDINELKPILLELFNSTVTDLLEIDLDLKPDDDQKKGVAVAIA